MHQKLFFLLVLLLPVQLGRHFWPDFSLVFGIRVDYLAPTVYLTDLLVIALLGAWAWEKRRNIVSLLHGFIVDKKAKEPALPAGRQLNNKTILIFLLAISYLLFTSLFIAQNQGAALYKLAKLCEFFALGLYVYKNRQPARPAGGTVIGDWRFGATLSVAVLYSSLIAWAQFLLQESTGALWWLGERTFSAQTPGIALTSVFGQEMLRPYSIFPHPNALAGFLLVSLVLIAGGKRNFLTTTAFILGSATIFISFSQSAWIAGSAIFLFVLFSKKWQRLPLLNLIFLLVLVGSIIVPFLPVFSNLLQEVVFRQELAQAAGKMIAQNPIFGVGLNNFVPRLPGFSGVPQVSWWLQPVHNIFLLVFAETGLAGLSFLVWLLFSVFKKLENWKLATGLLAILLTGVADHYWLTLQQNQLLLIIVLFLGARGKLA